MIGNCSDIWNVLIMSKYSKWRIARYKWWFFHRLYFNFQKPCHTGCKAFALTSTVDHPSSLLLDQFSMTRLSQVSFIKGRCVYKRWYLFSFFYHFSSVFGHFDCFFKWPPPLVLSLTHQLWEIHFDKIIWDALPTNFSLVLSFHRKYKNHIWEYNTTQHIIGKFESTKKKRFKVKHCPVSSFKPLH